LIIITTPQRSRISKITKSTSTTTSSFSNDEIEVSKQFKILTCSASSCLVKRKKLSLSEYATFSAFWERIDNAGLLNTLLIEESSCLGGCQYSPCVAVEHDDYDGTVALTGMETSEFVNRIFHNVIDNHDVDRVWGIIENSIRIMANEPNDDQDDDDDMDENSNAV
jgi:(2Fe-2S) ferredoxin